MAHGAVSRAIAPAFTEMPKYTFNNTHIRPIDVKAFARTFDTPEPCEIKTFDGYIESPKQGLTSDEMVVFLLNKNGEFVIDLYPADYTDDKGVTHISLFPKWSATFSPADLKPFLGEPVMLAEFTKERRGYNGRLENNEAGIVRWLNQRAN